MQIDSLETGEAHPFSAWPNASVPKVAAGVYTVWFENRYIYVGMAGRGLSTDALLVRAGQPSHVTGLFSRLDSHASGRRSGDQFCVYLCDRFVLPTLSREEIAEIEKGRLSLDRKIRHFVRTQLTYRFVITASGHEASALEGSARRGLPVSGPPLLNPAPGSRLAPISVR